MIIYYFSFSSKRITDAQQQLILNLRTATKQLKRVKNSKKCGKYAILTIFCNFRIFVFRSLFPTSGRFRFSFIFGRCHAFGDVIVCVYHACDLNAQIAVFMCQVHLRSFKRLLLHSPPTPLL